MFFDKITKVKDNYKLYGRSAPSTAALQSPRS